MGEIRPKTCKGVGITWRKASVPTRLSARQSTHWPSSAISMARAVARAACVSEKMTSLPTTSWKRADGCGASADEDEAQFCGP